MAQPGLKVYLGYDAREHLSYRVASRSIMRRISCPVAITPLDITRIEGCGLMRRLTDRRDHRYDLISNARASTDFAISRFLTPILAQTGWALFADSDIVCLADLKELFTIADPRYAVMCVKHEAAALDGQKMDGQPQASYPRKLWSSVMLFNCDHPGNRRLSLDDVRERPGRDLHAFYWLHDDEIGSLPAEWNWLVGVQPRPAVPKIAHFTLGTPEVCHGGVEADLWLREVEEQAA